MMGFGITRLNCELYYKVFGCGMENAHDALTDILATKECFFELKTQFKAKASSVPMSAKRTDLSDLPFLTANRMPIGI